MYYTLRIVVLKSDGEQHIPDRTELSELCAVSENPLQLPSPISVCFAAGHLDLVAVAVLGPLKKSARENIFFLVKTARFNKRKSCIPLRSIAAALATAASLKYWVCA